MSKLEELRMSPQESVLVALGKDSRFRDATVTIIESANFGIRTCSARAEATRDSDGKRFSYAMPTWLGEVNWEEACEGTPLEWIRMPFLDALRVSLGVPSVYGGFRLVKTMLECDEDFKIRYREAFVERQSDGKLFAAIFDDGDGIWREVEKQ